MKTLMISIFLIASASPAFPNGTPETFDGMIDSMLTGSVRQIETRQLQSMLDSGVELYIIDSRSSAEYRTSRLKNAIFTDFETFSPETVEDIPKSAAIVVYCSVGYRSEKTGEKLLEAGYSDVYNLRGGIFQWVNEERQIYNSTGKTTEIHGYSEDWSRWLDKGEIIF